MFSVKISNTLFEVIRINVCTEYVGPLVIHYTCDIQELLPD
jgi:hypothetical protein